MGRSLAVAGGSQIGAQYGGYAVLGIVRARKREAEEHPVRDVSENENVSDIRLLLTPRLWALPLHRSRAITVSQFGLARAGTKQEQTSLRALVQIWSRAGTSYPHLIQAERALTSRWNACTEISPIDVRLEAHEVEGSRSRTRRVTSVGQ